MQHYPYQMEVTEDSFAINYGIFTVKHSELKNNNSEKPFKLEQPIIEIEVTYWKNTVCVITPHEICVFLLNMLPNGN